LLHSVAARGQATNVNRAPYAMLVLAAIGIFDATYVAASNYTGQPLWCPIIDGCNVVLNSPYSRVFGVPMSYFGFIYYLFMFTLAARLAYDPLSAKLAISRAIVCGGGGRDFDLLHVFELGVITAVCVYCVISAVTTFLMFAAALWHFQVTRGLGQA